MMCLYCPYQTLNVSSMNQHTMYSHPEMMHQSKISYPDFNLKTELLPKDKTLKKLSFHFGIPVSDLEKALRSKD